MTLDEFLSIWDITVEEVDDKKILKNLARSYLDNITFDDLGKWNIKRLQNYDETFKEVSKEIDFEADLGLFDDDINEDE